MLLLRVVLWQFAPAWLGLLLFSGALNVLALTGSVFLLQIYDRVLPARSAPTLIAFTGLVFGLYVAYGVIDFCRGRVASRVGMGVAEMLLQSRHGGSWARAKADLDLVFEFFAGAAFAALLDVAWVPVFLGTAFLMHPLVGAYVLAAVGVLGLLGAYAARRADAGERHAAGRKVLRDQKAALFASSDRCAAAVRSETRDAVIGSAARAYEQARLSARDAAQGAGAVLRAARLLSHGGLLALSAGLVLDGALTGGMMMAATLILARALMPVETMASQWPRITAFHATLVRMAALERPDTRVCPAGLLALVPSRGVEAEGVSLLSAQGVGVSFALRAGDGLGIVGPSGAGKSLLMQAIAGYAPAGTFGAGVLRLDGAPYRLWGEDALARHIGYLPQHPVFLPGTIADAITRFAADGSDPSIVAAARAAGAHEAILRLPAGYQTLIGEAGFPLSRGLAQRIGLARALYGSPFLVVLDEPSSGLDGAGEAALLTAIQGMRERGGIVIVAAHRASELAGVDRVLALGHGRVIGLGPKEEMLRRLAGPHRVSGAPPQGAGLENDMAGGGGA